MAEQKKRDEQKPTKDDPTLAAMVAVAGWLVPGLGHLLLRRWGRAAVYFLAVGAFAATGLALRGNVFSASSGDAFDILGFLADLGAGVFYFAAKFVADGGPDISRAAGDYGTRFFASAGVLNLLCVLDAHQIARGRKA